MARSTEGKLQPLAMTQPFPLPEPMRVALDCARAAADAGEVPIGAVVTRAGDIIATGENRNRRDHDPTAHAEMVAIRAAARTLGTDRLTDCDLWVTLGHAPCAPAPSPMPASPGSIMARPIPRAAGWIMARACSRGRNAITGPRCSPASARNARRRCYAPFLPRVAEPAGRGAIR